jgi:hypothetical protein
MLKTESRKEHKETQKRGNQEEKLMYVVSQRGLSL